jgi:hypothetical protein
MEGKSEESSSSEGKQQRRRPAIELPADAQERERLLKSEQRLDEKYRQLQELLVRWPVALYDIREFSYTFHNMELIIISL